MQAIVFSSNFAELTLESLQTTINDTFLKLSFFRALIYHTQLNAAPSTYTTLPHDKFTCIILCLPSAKPPFLHVSTIFISSPKP